MSFNRIIDNIMRDVESGSKEPFIIYRDSGGGWHSSHTQNQYGEDFTWVEDVKKRDPLALTFTGADFAKASFPRVYDIVLCSRLNADFYLHHSSGDYCNAQDALVEFFNDNVGAFSHTVTDYLTEFDRPLHVLSELCSLSLETSNPDWTYNKDLVADAVEKIEDTVSERLSRTYNEVVPDDKRSIEGYEEKLCIKLGGQEVVLAENPDAAMPYLVCNITYDNPLGIEERSNGAVSEDYVEMMREFVKRVDTIAVELEADQRQFGLPAQIMSAADCLPGSSDMDWKDKAVIIKAEALAPEYRSAQHQLYLCTGGFGAQPDARGQKVYVKGLSDGKECYYRRHQIAGIADTSKLPEWATAKLLQHTRPDTDKKPSLLGKLDTNKQKVEQDKAERKDIPKVKKHGDMEVE